MVSHAKGFLLQGRNRSLAAENGVLRQECDQANQAVDSLRQDLAAARGQSDRQEVLIKQLEQDLISRQAAHKSFTASMHMMLASYNRTDCQYFGNTVSPCSAAKGLKQSLNEEMCAPCDIQA